MGTLTTFVFALWAAVAQPMGDGLPVCEPAPKETVVELCEPGEGCSERWIFVPRYPQELPVS